MAVKRYHPTLVVLHWLVAFMLVVALLMGKFVLEATPNSSPEKIVALKGHMIAGGLILVLTIIRLAVKVMTDKPPKILSGNAFRDKLAVGIHHGFYLFILAMAATGIGTSISAGLPDIVFGGSGTPLPKDFHEFAPRLWHGIIAKILFIMVVLHIAGAMVHQYKLKDKIMDRMKFGG